MTILVTGGAGYIGSHMVWRLLEADEEVVVIDNLSTGHASALPREVMLIQADVGNTTLMSEVLRNYSIEAIMHFAAWSNLPNSLSDPLGYYANNTAMSLSLIRAAVAAKVNRFIFSSSAAVYGTTSSQPVSEDTVPIPSSPYGRTKRMTEQMLEDTAAAGGLEFVALRYFNVAGADPALRTGPRNGSSSSLMKAACEAATGKRKALQVFGTDYDTPDGSCIRDYVHVADLVEAHHLALKYLRRGGSSRILNCGYGIGYSVLEVVRAVQNQTGGAPMMTLCNRRPGDIAEMVADTSAIRDVLGWAPKYNDVSEIARHALAWERKLVAEEGAPKASVARPRHTTALDHAAT